MVVRSKLQWWLQRIEISNEGYSNEIIFDLTDIDIVGPLPPSPIEVWDGGYVDYPFQSMGTKGIQAADGYLSPEGNAWIKNVPMIWDQSQPLFDGTVPDAGEGEGEGL